MFILTKQAIAVNGKAVFIGGYRVVNSDVDIRQLSIFKVLLYLLSKLYYTARRLV